MKRLNIKIEPETHRKLKLYAVHHETSLQALILSLIKHLIAQTPPT